MKTCVRTVIIALGLFLAASLLDAQNIPAGTALPVALNATLNGHKNKPGEKIAARLMQEVALPSGEKIKAGAHVTGHIVSVTKATGTFRVALQFDAMEAGGKTIPLHVAARAIADSNSVFQAKLPVNTASDSESSNEWVTRQVGGDVVNRGRGQIGSGDQVVGTWNGSAWGKLLPPADGSCPATEGGDRIQALWVFSTSACGVYGLEGVKLVQAGRSDPVGQIVLESAKPLVARDGSGWMLVEQ